MLTPYWDRFELDELRQMYFKPDEVEKCTVTKGDLLICEGGDIGRSAIWNFDFDMRIQNHIHKLRGIIPEETCAEYFYYMMWLYKQNGWINGRGIGLQGFSSKCVHSLVIPLPPYQEQIRIAERIREIFNVLDEIDELQNQYSLDVEALKSKLIDAGIQGKLSEQLPEDGTAEELYQQIQTEKKQLEKEGKIKKGKKLPDITAEEIPFEIPDNWKWVRIGSILRKLTDGTHHSPINTQSGEYMYVTAKNIKDEGVILDEITYVSKEVHDDIYSRCDVELGDVLLIKDGATAGVATVNNISKPYSMLSSVALLKCSRSIDAQYLVYVLRSSAFYKNLRNQMTGVGITRITLKMIESFVMPLPPYNEQKRISERIGRLLQRCQ